MGNSQPSYFSPQMFVPSPNTNLKGLINPLGENNCFLNVVIQSLWHLDSFSTAPFLLMGSSRASLVVLVPGLARHAPLAVVFTFSVSTWPFCPQGQDSRELRRSISTRRPTACFARSRFV